MPDDLSTAPTGADSAAPAGVNPSWTAAAMSETPTPTSPPADFQVPVVHVPVNPAPVRTTAMPPVATGLPQVPKPPSAPPPPVALPPAVPAMQPPVRPAPATAPVVSRPQPIANPSAATTPPPQPARVRRGTPLGLKIFVGAALLVVIAASGFAWWEGYLFGAPRDAKMALVRMGAAVKIMQSYHFEGSGKLNFTMPATYTQAAAQGEPSSVDVVSIVGDRVSTSGAKTALTLNLTGLGSVVPTSVPKTVSLETVQSQGGLYVNVPFLASLASTQRTATWYSLSADTLPLFTKTADNVQSLTSRQLSSIVTSAKYVGTEALADAETAHYRYTLDGEALVGAFPMAQLASINSYIASQPIVVDLWLGTRSLLPYKVSFSSVNQTAADNFTITMQFSQFGDSLSIPTISGGTSTAALSDLVPASLAQLQVAGRDLQRKSDLASIKTALGFYQAATGSYPSTQGKVVRTNDPANPLKAIVEHGDLQKMPVDPIDPTDWYGYTSDGTTFELTSILENAADLDGTPSGSITLYEVASTTVSAPAADTAGPGPLLPSA